jgi:hypothetical protein
MEVANTLAYYDTARIKVVKSYIVQYPEWLLVTRVSCAFLGHLQAGCECINIPRACV